MMKKAILIAMAAMSMTAVAKAAPAASADDAIIYRKGLMGIVSGNLGGLTQAMQGKLDDPRGAKIHAEMLAQSASLALSSYKMNTTGKGKERTTVKTEIWSDWANYEKSMKAFEAQAQKISTLVASGDMKAAGGEMGTLVKSCKSCHETYRQKH